MPNISATEKPFVLAHFSDPHIACIDGINRCDLFNKRLYGYLKWKLRRSAEHRSEILATLKKDLQRTEPDHMAITGDLTHLSLPLEFLKARQWLQSLGVPDRVSVVPGNHDTYVRTDWRQTLGLWEDYMVSDSQYQQVGPANGFDGLFPTMRVRGRIAIIGVCTAHTSLPYLATGSIGSRQLKKLEALLKEAAHQRFFRIMMIHHPPVSGIVSWRKRLTDAPGLRRLLAQYGTELILHGHAHTQTCRTLKTPSGSTPVIGVPSASSIGRTHERRARYNLYAISPVDHGWTVVHTEQIYSPDDLCFFPEKELHFHLTADQL